MASFMAYKCRSPMTPAMTCRTCVHAMQSPVTGVPRMVRLAARRTVMTHAEAESKSTTARIVVQAKGTTVTPAMKDYAMEKVSLAVHNFQADVKEVDVHMSVRSRQHGQQGPTEHTVELVAYTLRNGTLRVEDTQETMYAALDTSSQKLKNVLGRTKEKAMQRGKWPGHADTRGATKLSQALAEEGSEVSEDETATA